MVPILPAFGGVPGGPELLILLVLALFLIGVPAVVIAAVILLIRGRSDNTDERIATLEAEVERLREELGDERDG